MFPVQILCWALACSAPWWETLINWQWKADPQRWRTASFILCFFFFFPTWGFRPSHANIFPLEPVNSYHDLNNYSMVFTWLILHGFYLTCSHTLNNNFLSKSPPRLHRPAVPKQGLGLQTVKNLSIIHPKNSSYEIVETAKSFWV